MNNPLKPGEELAIKLLLKTDSIRNGLPFTSSEAWQLIRSTPSESGTRKKMPVNGNKYKLTYILKKSTSFTRTRAKDGTSVWIYKGDNNASR